MTHAREVVEQKQVRLSEQTDKSKCYVKNEK